MARCWTISEIIRLAESTGDTVSDAEDPVGTLSIGSISTIATGVLPDAIAQLSARHPRLRVLVVHGLSAEVMTMVDRRHIDGGFVSSPVVNRRWT